jgi:hypothetical protein
MPERLFHGPGKDSDTGNPKNHGNHIPKAHGNFIRQVSRPIFSMGRVCQWSHKDGEQRWVNVMPAVVIGYLVHIAAGAHRPRSSQVRTNVGHTDFGECTAKFHTCAEKDDRNEKQA